MKEQFLKLCLALMLAAMPAWADVPRTLQWKDLVPPLQGDHPFARLTRHQALQLSDIADIRDRKARGEKVSAIDLEDERAATQRLQKAGVDVDGLLAQRAQIAERNRQQQQSVNPALNGQTIRMPGYLLPLEFTGKEVTEFLLVPWVGACIHTPPPPLNQIVHVRSDKPVGNVGMFMPIWVTGTMSAAPSKQALYLVDGEAKIDVGYSLKATTVEPYKDGDQ
jgi:hypothetical protein